MHSLSIHYSLSMHEVDTTTCKYLLQIKIKSRLKFFSLGWFSFFLCLLALIIHDLELGDKGNWESTLAKK